MSFFKPKPERGGSRERLSKKNVGSTRRFPLKAGERVGGKYLIESVIGGGGFSIVYRVYDTEKHETFVLKEYFPNMLSRRDSKNRIVPLNEDKVRSFNIGIQQFFAEALALSRIKHHHILSIENVFRENNTAYMVSRLQVGKDLRWFIKSCQGDLDQKFLHKVIPPIISGLFTMHNRGFLHLDIKPANILLRSQGGPLLLDFGAAKSIESQEKFNSFQTLTPGFAPPEQHHRKDLSPASDIYALGATVYACITGRAPPTSLNREDKIKELQFKGLDKKITASMIDALRWSLELSPRDRPRTMVEFGDAFLQDSNWGNFANFEKARLEAMKKGLSI